MCRDVSNTRYDSCFLQCICLTHALLLLLFYFTSALSTTSDLSMICHPIYDHSVSLIIVTNYKLHLVILYLYYGGYNTARPLHLSSNHHFSRLSTLGLGLSTCLSPISISCHVSSHLQMALLSTKVKNIAMMCAALTVIVGSAVYIIGGQQTTSSSS